MLARELQQRGVPFLIYSGADAFKELANEFREVQWIERSCDIPTGVRPCRWTASCCGFDQALGVLILKVDGTAVTKR